MGGSWRRVTVAVAAAAFVAGASATTVWAQGEWVAPPDAKAMKNPQASKAKDPKELAEAKKVVETNCVPCHGPSGKGDGPAAAALPTKPADWTSAKVQKETDGELFWKISNGRGAMPPWKHLPDKDRWAVVNYIRTLKK